VYFILVTAASGCLPSQSTDVPVWAGRLPKDSQQRLPAKPIFGRQAMSKTDKATK